VQEYERLEAIGRGSYAKVYRGRHKRTDKNVAIKCINISDKNGLPSTAIREVTMLQELRHPHIVRCFPPLRESHARGLRPEASAARNSVVASIEGTIPIWVC
jgi:serine/threonine protein kinase